MDWHESAKQEHFTRPSPWPWVAALVAVAAGGAFVVTRGGPEEPAPASEPLPLVALEHAAEAERARPPLPPARETDARVRELLGDLLPLSDARDLARRFVSAVNQIADGETPRAQLDSLTPNGGFRAHVRDGQLVIDERSYQRYDAAAEWIGALDATRAAAVMRELEPILERIHEELGARDRTFRESLALAVEHLVHTPIPEGPVRLRRERMFYAYADPSLERLFAAQKQLLRMGPRNARLVQSKLRELAAALELATGPGGVHRSAAARRAPPDETSEASSR